MLIWLSCIITLFGNTVGFILAVTTVVIQAEIIGAFRTKHYVLYVIYAMIKVIATVTYLMIEQHLIWSVERNKRVNEENMDVKTDNVCSMQYLYIVLSSENSEGLSWQELRVAELVFNEYTGKEMTTYLVFLKIL